MGDRLLDHSETDFTNDDGRWVPTSIRFFEGESASPHKVIEVQQASYDQPEHAQEITPSDFGLLFGTLMHQDDRSAYWSETGLISVDDYYELLRLYGVRPDRRILEFNVEGMGITVEEYLAQLDQITAQARDSYYAKHGEAPWLSVKSTEKDEWDLYVEEFIKEHKFDEPRVKRAKEILKRAKQLRDVYKRKNITEIRKAQRYGDRKKLAMFEAHTEAVFDKVLVSGLKKLVPEKTKTKK